MPMGGRVIFLISDMASCPRRLSIRSDDWLIMYTNNPVKVAVVGGASPVYQLPGIWSVMHPGRVEIF